MARRHRQHGKSRKMLKISRRNKPGASPGLLSSQPGALASSMKVLRYTADRIDEAELAGTDALPGDIGRGDIVWIDVTGLADVALVERIGAAFGLHPLALEDVVHTHQRPKTEDYENHLFIVTRMACGAEAAEHEQVSLFLGKGYVITFQERPGDCFEPVRERLRRGRGRLRGAGADYLAYALIDAVIDGYFLPLEAHGERIEQLEDEVTRDARSDHIDDIHAVKRDLLALRRAIWPQREMLNILVRDENSLIQPATRVYLRDAYDHVIQLMDMLETYREIASGLVDIHLSAMSTRMNEIMKVLTVIASIFIPLSFIAGVYGMNFDPAASPWNMPELGWTWGYPFALLLMFGCALGLLWYFRRKGFIGGERG